MFDLRLNIAKSKVSAFSHVLGLGSVSVRAKDRVSGSSLCQCSFIYEKLYEIVRHRFLGVLPDALVCQDVCRHVRILSPRKRKSTESIVRGDRAQSAVYSASVDISC